MTIVITWFETLVSSIPLPMLEVWGRFAYIVGLFLAISRSAALHSGLGSMGIRPDAAEVGHEGIPQPAADIRADHRDRLHRIIHRAGPGRTDV